MSVINQMLRDLDRREVSDRTGAARAADDPPPARRRHVGSEAFWRLLAFLMAACVAWVLWLMWQISPRSVVNPGVLERVHSGPGARLPSRASNDEPVPATAPAVSQANPQANPSQPSQPQPNQLQPMLRLATEIVTPLAIPSATAAPQAGKSARATSRGPDPAVVRIAETEYRRALELARHGRSPEAIESLRMALRIHPGMLQARQMLVSYLIDAGRYEESARVLEGIPLNASNLRFTMLMALDAQAKSQPRGPEFHGFRATVYQRVNRHSESVAAYDEALQLSPETGPWWLGRGISLQALSRSDEARESYRRAIATGTLSVELLRFAEAQLRKLE